MLPPLARCFRRDTPIHFFRRHKSNNPSPPRSPPSQEPLSPTPPSPPITHGSAHHSSLTTFLAHAARTNLSPTSTLYVGTHYEYTVQAALARLGFALTRTGRASDQGIDLLGEWTLPSPRTERGGVNGTVRVLLQCKALKSGAAPSHVRELEGAFAGVPAEWRRGPGDGIVRAEVMAFLAATQKASRGVTEALGRSRWPMGFLKVSAQGRVEQFLWNRSAEERGLQGLGVTLRYSGGAGAEGEVEGEEEVGRDVALTWMGEPVLSDGEATR